MSESIQFLNAGIVGVLETTLIGGSFGKQINATTADGSMIHFIRIDSQSESSDIVLSGDDVRTHSSISVPDISDVLGVHGKVMMQVSFEISQNYILQLFRALLRIIMSIRTAIPVVSIFPMILSLPQ